MPNPPIPPAGTKRDAMVGRLRSKYADKKFEDDDEVFGQIGEDYDSYDKQIADYSAREKTFSDLFTSDPRSAYFMQNWRKGGDPVVALIREFGDDIREALDDPERLDQIAEANKEYAARVAKEKELNDEYMKNLNESLAYLTKLEQDGMSPDDLDKVMEFLMKITTDGLMGKFTPEAIEMAKKALNFDTAVQSASDEGEIRGRNAKIDERLRKAKKGDGTMPLAGGNGPAQKQPMPDFGAVSGMGDQGDIWKRGGEKRITR